MGTPKRHHYLPQFYLERFCRNKILQIFDRESCSYRGQAPKNTATIGHYYTVTDKHGNKNTDIETFLSKIEGLAKPIIDKVDNSAFITDEEKLNLSIFLSLLWVRVPEFENFLNEASDKLIKKLIKHECATEEQAEAILKEQEQSGEQLQVTANDLVEFVQNEQYSITVPRDESLRQMLSISRKIAAYLSLMNLLFIQSEPNTSFITTDNPFTLVPPQNYNEFFGIGIITKGAIKVVPLSRKTCLTILDSGNSINYKKVSINEVKSINCTVAGNCARFIFGRDEALVKSIVKTTRIDQLEKQGRVQIV